MSHMNSGRTWTGQLSAGLFLIGLVSASARAAETSFLVEAVREIESPGEAVRVLFDFEGLESLEGKGISAAFLIVPVSESVPEESIDVQAFAIETNWRGSTPTWTSPWRQAGGDLGFESSVVTLEAGETPRGLRLNVTQIVRSIVMEGKPSHGILLTIPLGRGEGLAEVDRGCLGDLEGTVLAVTYVNAVPRESVNAE